MVNGDLLNIHNKVVPYSELKIHVPDRSTFLDKNDNIATSADMKNRAPLHFLPTYLMETSMQDEKYGKAKYKIVLMGILRDGRRVNVLLDGIKPFFEVQLNDASAEEQKSQVNELFDILEKADLDPIENSVVIAKPFKGYQKHNSKFVRLGYEKTKTRADAIKLVRKHGFKTTCDDLSCYYRVVCRDQLTTFSSWAMLNDYTIDSVDQLKGVTIRLNYKNYKAHEGEIPDSIKKDKTLTCCFDIETSSEDGDVPQPERKGDKLFCLSMTFQWVSDNKPLLKICLCDLPANSKPGYLTIICGNEKNIIEGFSKIFELMRPEYIFGFNDSDYDWNWIIKRAKQYKGLLTKMATNMDCTVPYKPYTDETVFNWNFKKEHVKVEADTYIDGYSLMMHGYIPVDVRTIFRRLYPTAEQSSLKWFLAKNKLGGKEDMPYEEMFKIYRRYTEFINRFQNNNISNVSNIDDIDPVFQGKAIDFDKSRWHPEDFKEYEDLKEQLALINNYCVVDAWRCHELMKIRSVIIDHREVSHLAYTSMYDAFYRANGMKVRNLTIAVGQGKHFNIRFTNISNQEIEEGKYPGAFVVPPKKGLNAGKLSIKERIAKAEETKHLETRACQEWLNTTDEEVQQMYKYIEKYGAYVHEARIPEIEKEEKTQLSRKFKEFWAEPIGRPIVGLDFASLYPSLVMCYNFSPEYCVFDKKVAQEISATGQKLTRVEFDFNGRKKIAWFIFHNNKYNPEEPGFQFGVYPYILNDLFNRRSAIKKKMKSYEHRKEEIEALSKEEQAKLADEYEDVVFNYNYYKCKQNALKVFMNTFYGEAGNKLSPFFVMEVAGGITTYGKRSLKFAYAYVKERGCNVYYGDSVAGYTPILVNDGIRQYYTRIDSLFPDHYYQVFNNGKELVMVDNTKQLQVWSDKGWTDIKHVVRHYTNKKMYRIVTQCGVVDVTADHSLLDEKSNVIKPEDSLNTRLLHNPKFPEDYIKTYYENNETSDQLAAAKIFQSANFHKTQNPVLEIKDGKYKTVSGQIDDRNKVIKIIELPETKDYVYDLETENHHFSAGVGELVVHNTDSLYISVPEETFLVVDKEFYTDKIEKLAYWTALVEITFKEIESLRDGVNKAFVADTTTKYLSMAYEEVLFPVAFTAKKKYFGIPHENIPNFKPKDLFVRGLEVKKRGVSDILRKIFTEIMWTCCSTENKLTLLELVQNKIDEIYTRKWEAKDFIQTGVYRPGRLNVKINTFVERMRKRGVVVKPNERFNYVLVKKYPYSYDLRGRKENISIGDKIELAEEFEKQGMEIDLDYYMEGSINGQLARLITYHEMFYVPPEDETDDALKIAEDKIYKNACKFIENYCKKYYASYNTFGKTHQKIFRLTSKLLSNKLHSSLPAQSVRLLTANVDHSQFKDWFIKDCEKQAEKMTKNYGSQFVESELKRVANITKNNMRGQSEDAIKAAINNARKERLSALQRIYYSSNSQSWLYRKELEHKNNMAVLMNKLDANNEKYLAIYHKYDLVVGDLITLLQNKIGLSEELYIPSSTSEEYKLEDFVDEDPEQLVQRELDEKANERVNNLQNDEKFSEILTEMKQTHDQIYTELASIHRTRSVVEYLKLKRDQAARITIVPNGQNIRDVISNSVEDTNDEVTQLEL